MKGILFSDTHNHNFRQFSSITNGLNSRFKEQIVVIEQIKDIIEEEDIKFGVFAGDLFHLIGSIEVDVFNIVMDLYGDFPCPLYFVDGNHDTLLRRGKLKWFQVSFNNLFEKDLHRLQGLMNIDGVRVYGVGYLDELPKGEEEYDLIVLHRTPKGSVYGGYTFEEGVDWKILEQKSKFVAFGHIHQPQVLSAKSFVIGAPMPYNFGDTGERGVWIIDFDTNERVFRPLQSKKFITVNKLEEYMVNDRDNYYRVLEGSKGGGGNILVAGSEIELEERLKGNTLEDWISEYVTLQDKGDNEKRYGLSLLNNLVREAELVPVGWLLNDVELNNFLSIGNVKYSIPRGVVVVVGDGDDFKSNGTGKTSLFDGICWVLFGETTKGILSDDVVNSFMGKDCYGKLRLVKGPDVLEILRYRKHTEEINSLIIKLNGKELGRRSADTQELVVRELGFDKEVFLNLAYFSQEKLTMISEMSDSQRQGFLNKLLGLERLEQLKKVVKDEQKILNDLILKNSTKLEVLRDGRVKIENELQEIESKKDAEDKVIKEDIEVIKEKTAEVDKILYDIGERLLETKIAYDTKKKEVVSEELYNELDKVHTRSNNYYWTIHSQRNVLKDKLANITNLVEGQLCDTCGAEVTSATLDSYKDSITKVIHEKDVEIEQLWNALEVSRNNLEVERKDVKLKREKLGDDLSTLGEELQKLERLKSENVSYLKDLQLKEIVLSSDISTPLAIDKLSKELVQVNDKIKEFTREDILLGENLELVEFWVEGFGKDGIPALLLDRFCNTFNRKVNYYLGVISNGIMRVMLSSRKKLKSGEVRDKIDIIVENNGQLRSYNALSGGEKKRIDIALMLALDNVLRGSFNLKDRLLGILILDEVFGFLDVDGEEGVAQILNELGSEAAIFVVSHTSELASYFSKKWVVKKEKGISSLIEESV